MLHGWLQPPSSRPGCNISFVHLNSEIRKLQRVYIKYLNDSLPRSLFPPAQMSLFGRLFIRFSKKTKPSPKRSLSSSPLMSSSATAAALYAATVSSSAITGASPEEVKEKRHHVKDGKGFVNPWDSWKEMQGPAIAREMIWYAARSAEVAELIIEGDGCPGRPINLRQHLLRYPSGNRTFFPPEIRQPCAQPG